MFFEIYMIRLISSRYNTKKVILDLKVT